MNPSLARCTEVRTTLLQRATDVVLGSAAVNGTVELRLHAIALGQAVSTAVAAICFNGRPPFYADLWRRDDACFADLAAFLAYWFVVSEPVKDDVKHNALLELSATIYPASRRAKELADRFVALWKDPAEMRQRHILGIFTRSADDEARSVVGAFIINELLGGPSLELDVQDGSNLATAADRAELFWLRGMLLELQLALTAVYKGAVLGGYELPLSRYTDAADSAITVATVRSTRHSADITGARGTGGSDRGRPGGTHELSNMRTAPVRAVTPQPSVSV